MSGKNFCMVSRLILFFIFCFGHSAAAMNPPSRQCQFASNDLEIMICILDNFPPEKIASVSFGETFELKVEKWFLTAKESPVSRKKLGQVIKIYITNNFPAKKLPPIQHLSRLLALIQLCVEEQEQQENIDKLLELDWPNLTKVDPQAFADTFTIWQLQHLESFMGKDLEDWVKDKGKIADYFYFINNITRSLAVSFLCGSNDFYLDFIFKVAKRLSAIKNYDGEKKIYTLLTSFDRVFSAKHLDQIIYTFNDSSHKDQYIILMEKHKDPSSPYKEKETKNRIMAAIIEENKSTLPVNDIHLCNYKIQKSGDGNWIHGLAKFYNAREKAKQYKEQLSIDQELADVLESMPSIPDEAFEELYFLKKKPNRRREMPDFNKVDFSEWNETMITDYFEKRENADFSGWKQLLKCGIMNAKQINELLDKVADKGRMLAKLWKIDINEAKRLLGEDSGEITESDGSGEKQHNEPNLDKKATKRGSSTKRLRSKSTKSSLLKKRNSQEETPSSIKFSIPNEESTPEEPLRKQSPRRLIKPLKNSSSAQPPGSPEKNLKPSRTNNSGNNVPEIQVNEPNEIDTVVLTPEHMEFLKLVSNSDENTDLILKGVGTNIKKRITEDPDR